jgi:hypothetical protein
MKTPEQSALQRLINAARERGVELELGKPATEVQMSEFSREFSGTLAAYQKLLAEHNGMNIAGMRLLSTAECHWMDRGIAAIQNWGNGDFDAILTDSHEEGSVWFCNHAPDVRVKVGLSLADWLGKLANEIEVYGFVGHPRDFVGGGDTSRTYGNVLSALSHINCELTRWMNRKRG